jgi:translation elongation factor EF-1alpha
MDGERVFSGDVLVRSGDLRTNVFSRRRLVAKVEVKGKTLIKGTELTLVMNALSVSCVVAHVLDGDKRMLRSETRGRCTLVLKRPVCLETYEACKKLGRFLLLDGARIAAVGLVEELL